MNTPLRVIPLALTLGLGASVEVAAQERVVIPYDPVPFTLLQRPSYFHIKWPDKAYYEGDVMFPVNMYSRTAALRSFAKQDVEHRSSDCTLRHNQPVVTVARGSDANTHWIATGCTLIFTPHFVVRQLSSSSAPVRTPTFNPELEFTWYALGSRSPTPRRQPDLSRGAWLLAGRGRVAHYSNGQSGCFYMKQTQDAAGNCQGDAQLTDSLNTVDGSFSTDYLEAELTLGHLTFVDTTDHRLLTFSSAVRYNAPWKVGGMDGTLAKLYKRWNYSARIESRNRYHHKFPLFPDDHTYSAILFGECAPNRPKPYEACRGNAEVSISFPGFYGFGFDARYVAGWDYYNIGFRDQLKNQRHGLPIFGLIFHPALPSSFNALWPKAG